MEKYIPFEFKGKYKYETPSERYTRLMEEFSTGQTAFLDGLRNTLNNQPTDEMEESIALCRKQTNDLRLAIEACWNTTAQERNKGPLPRSFAQSDAELYLIESLARVCEAFKHPSNVENTQQLLLLAQEIPGNTEGYWHALKGGLLYIITLAAAIALLPISPVTGVPILIIGSVITAYSLVGAEVSFKSQPVKTGLDLIAKNPSFFSPSQSSEQSTLAEGKDSTPVNPGQRG